MIKCGVQDKLNVTIRPNLVTWYSFGQVQRTIKSKYRDAERSGTVPTFREFVKYLVRFTLTRAAKIALRHPDSGRGAVTQLEEYEENDTND